MRIHGKGRKPSGCIPAILAIGAVAIPIPRDSLTAQADADPASLVPGQTFRDCVSCPEMVVVPAGTFIMGSPESEEGRLRVVYDEEGEAISWTTDDAERLEVGAGQRLVVVEGPQRYVTIAAPFAVGVYEVTFEEWDACARGGGCGGLIPDHEGWGRGRRPVINVSWPEARSYAEWLSRETGEAYRLPSEAEWEYVARAGTETARYWGETEAAQCRHANGADAAALQEYPGAAGFTVSCSDGYSETAPVGSFSPNAFGLYDVLGNVWEWTLDCWNERYTGAPATAALGSRAIVQIACQGVAVGGTLREIFARPCAPGLLRKAAAATPACAWCGSSIEHVCRRTRIRLE